jgi:molecular chaperone HtpG
MIHMIRRGIARKVLGELLKLSRNDAPAYEAFWGQFGMILKEGIYDAIDHREDLFKLTRFQSTETDGLTSLEDYIERMKDGQDKIYYITGENAAALKKSPQIEGYRARGIEVLIMTDTIDSFWLQNANEFDGKMFQSVTKGAADLESFDENKEEKAADKDATSEDQQKTDIDALLQALKDNLSEDIGEVRISKRLKESPVCLVASEHGVDMHMENVLKIQQHYQPTAKRVLEVNADHAMIKTLSAQIEGGAPLIMTKEEVASFLIDQAKILQGEKLEDPSSFASHLTMIMQKAMS